MKHLLSIEDLDRTGIEEMLDQSDAFLDVLAREIPKVPALRGKTVVSLFYEESTRTRLSFETAAKRLSADTMSFAVGSSSVKKGESLLDTVKTIEAMGIDAMVVRHSAAGAPHRVAAVDRRIGDQRRRRAPRAPHAGAARCVHAAPPPRPVARRVPRRDRRRHQELAGRAQHDALLHQARRATSRSSRRRRCCPSGSTAGRSPSRTTSTTSSVRSTSPTCCGSRRNGSARRCSRACASTTRATG